MSRILRTYNNRNLEINPSVLAMIIALLPNELFLQLEARSRKEANDHPNAISVQSFFQSALANLFIFPRVNIEQKELLVFRNTSDGRPLLCDPALASLPQTTENLLLQCKQLSEMNDDNIDLFQKYLLDSIFNVTSCLDLLSPLIIAFCKILSYNRLMMMLHEICEYKKLKRIFQLPTQPMVTNKITIVGRIVIEQIARRFPERLATVQNMKDLEQFIDVHDVPITNSDNEVGFLVLDHTLDLLGNMSTMDPGVIAARRTVMQHFLTQDVSTVLPHLKAIAFFAHKLATDVDLKSWQAAFSSVLCMNQDIRCELEIIRIARARAMVALLQAALDAKIIKQLEQLSPQFDDDFFRYRVIMLAKACDVDAQNNIAVDVIEKTIAQLNINHGLKVRYAGELLEFWINAFGNIEMYRGPALQLIQHTHFFVSDVGIQHTKHSKSEVQLLQCATKFNLYYAQQVVFFRPFFTIESVRYWQSFVDIATFFLEKTEAIKSLTENDTLLLVVLRATINALLFHTLYNYKAHYNGSKKYLPSEFATWLFGKIAKTLPEQQQSILSLTHDQLLKILAGEPTSVDDENKSDNTPNTNNFVSPHLLFDIFYATALSAFPKEAPQKYEEAESLVPSVVINILNTTLAAYHKQKGAALQAFTVSAAIAVIQAYLVQCNLNSRERLSQYSRDPVAQKIFLHAVVHAAHTRQNRFIRSSFLSEELFVDLVFAELDTFSHYIRPNFLKVAVQTLSTPAEEIVQQIVERIEKRVVSKENDSEILPVFLIAVPALVEITQNEHTTQKLLGVMFHSISKTRSSKCVVDAFSALMNTKNNWIDEKLWQKFFENYARYALDILSKDAAQNLIRCIPLSRVTQALLTVCDMAIKIVCDATGARSVFFYMQNLDVCLTFIGSAVERFTSVADWREIAGKLNDLFKATTKINDLYEAEMRQKLTISLFPTLAMFTLFSNLIYGHGRAIETARTSGYMCNFFVSDDDSNENCRDASVAAEPKQLQFFN